MKYQMSSGILKSRLDNVNGTSCIISSVGIVSSIMHSSPAIVQYQYTCAGKIFNIMFIIEVILVTSLYSQMVICEGIARQKKDLNKAQYISRTNEKRFDEFEKHGPVTFSDTPDEIAGMKTQRSNSIDEKYKIRNGNKREPINAYPKIVEKYREHNGDRYEKVDSIPRLYQALAEHGAKVLRVPPEKLGKDHIPLTRDSTKKNNYAFFYKVVDRLTGDDFSHSQSRNSRVTNGEYRVKLPDGRVQIVSYRADKHGYKADVRYTENDAVEEEEHRLRGNPTRIHRVTRPIPQLIDFSGQRRNAPAELKALNAANALKARPPIVDSQSHGDYEDNPVSPSPAGYASAVDRNLQIPLPINVKIYTTNSRDQSIGSYIPFAASTIPYQPSNVEDHQRKSIFPQIIINGDQGIVVPVPTSSSFILTDQYGQVIDNIRLVSSTVSPLITTSTLSYFHSGLDGPFSASTSTIATPVSYRS